MDADKVKVIEAGEEKDITKETAVREFIKSLYATEIREICNNSWKENTLSIEQAIDIIIKRLTKGE